jgi:hypothetical protein
MAQSKGKGQTTPLQWLEAYHEAVSAFKQDYGIEVEIKIEPPIKKGGGIPVMLFVDDTSYNEWKDFQYSGPGSRKCPRCTAIMYPNQLYISCLEHGLYLIAIELYTEFTNWLNEQKALSTAEMFGSDKALTARTELSP